MSKFIVTRNSYFEPLSYDEIVKPLAELQTQHNEAQEAYDKMAMNTAALENYISKEGEDDARAREMYNNYKTKLQTLQDNLWANGVNAQTRRDLSAARNAYASDITRLAKAVEARQAASKAYWEARHKDPSLITGADPGLSGLDRYLENDLYGQDYYSYSGKQFASEVAADAQARANEMLSDPEVVKNPALQGYFLLKSREGYTSQEVQNASYAVRAALSGDGSLYEKLNPAEKILADTLSTHIESTGAAGKVDADQLGRLFNYGVEGLSQAIGKTSWSHLADKVWDNEQKALAAKGTGTTNTVGGGYTFDDSPIERRSPLYDQIESQLRDQNSAYADGKSIVMVAPDGTTRKFDNIFQATDEIYNTKERREVRDSLHGLDVGLWDKNQSVTFKDKDGKQHTWKATREGNKFIVVDEHGRKLAKESEIFHNGVVNFEKHVQQYRKANPNVSLHRVAISPVKEKSIRETLGLQPDTPTKFLEGLMSDMKYFDTPVTIAGTESGFDYYKKNLKASILNAIANAPKDKDGNLVKGSSYGFRKVDGNGNAGKDVSVDLKEVFGDKLDNDISSVYAFMDDILGNAGKNQTVRFTVPNTGTWEIRADMLGNRLNNVLNIYSDLGTIGAPIANKEAVVRMTKGENAEATQQMIKFFMEKNIQPPYITNSDGTKRYATFKETVTNKEARAQFRRALRQYLNGKVAVPRDISNTNHIQNVGNSSDNAGMYLGI